MAEGLQAVLEPGFDREHPRLAVGQQICDGLGRRGDMRRDDGRPPRCAAATAAIASSGRL